MIVIPLQNLTVAERVSSLRILTLGNAQFNSTVVDILIVLLKSERVFLLYVAEDLNLFQDTL